MIKKKPRTRLGLVLAGCTILSFLLGVATYLGLNVLSDKLIDRRIYSRETILQAETEKFSEFLSYMNEGGYYLSDRAAIQKWVSEQKNLMIAVYDARALSIQQDEAILYAGISDALTMYDLLQDEYADYWLSRLVSSGSDHMRSRVVKVMYYPMYHARTYAQIIDLALAFAVFVGVLLACIQRKTRYIALLSRELQVMQGGELGVPMTVRGRDELTSLALDIEEMRKSFIERLAHEDAMARNASELLTAMSHDLRTPLTALLGYLDIIDLGKCASEAQRDQYIHISKLKAYQIKEMTDKMFEYFLVYSPDKEKTEMETLELTMTCGQLWEESALILDTEGYSVEMRVGEQASFAEVNVPYLRRVFDNIVSNIRKYADRAAPITVTMGREADEFFVEVKNRACPVAPHAESSGIGLASCRKIMEKHGGSFVSGLEGEIYTCRLSLPARENEQGTAE